MNPARRNLIWAAALLAAATAVAVPRVSILVRELSEAEVQLAKLRLEGAPLEARFLDQTALHVKGRFVDLDDARRDAVKAWKAAREHFLADRLAQAREEALAATAAVAGHEGDPQVARTLAQLDLIAAQSGDKAGYARAAAHFPRLQLEEAQWSPEVRASFAGALAARAQQNHTQLVVKTQPPGATVYVDGVLLGVTPTSTALPIGEHGLLVFRDGFAPLERTLTLETNLEKIINAVLEPCRPKERLAGLRLRLELGGELPASELSGAASELKSDALVILDGSNPTELRARLAGPGLKGGAFERTGDRVAALSEVMDQLRSQVATSCAVGHSPPEPGRVGEILVLAATAGPCLQELHAAYRPAGTSAWATLFAPRQDGPIQLRLASLPKGDRPYTLEYYLWGVSLARSRVEGPGSASAPLRVPIAADRAATSPELLR